MTGAHFAFNSLFIKGFIFRLSSVRGADYYAIDIIDIVRETENSGITEIFSARGGSTVEGEQMGKLTVLPMDVVLFVAFVAYCLFCRKRELGLIGTFVFVYYLGFIFAKSPFIALGGESSSWVYIYGLGGLGLVCLFLVGFANKQSVSPEPQTDPQNPA